MGWLFAVLCLGLVGSYSLDRSGKGSHQELSACSVSIGEKSGKCNWADSNLAQFIFLIRCGNNNSNETMCAEVWVNVVGNFDNGQAFLARRVRENRISETEFSAEYFTIGFKDHDGVGRRKYLAFDQNVMSGGVSHVLPLYRNANKTFPVLIIDYFRIERRSEREVMLNAHPRPRLGNPGPGRSHGIPSSETSGNESSQPDEARHDTDHKSPERPVCRLSSGVCGLPLGAKIGSTIVLSILATCIWMWGWIGFLNRRFNLAQLIGWFIAGCVCTALIVPAVLWGSTH